MAELILVEGNGDPAQDRRVAALAAAMGIAVRSAVLNDLVGGSAARSRLTDGQRRCLALSADTLAYIHDAGGLDSLESTAVAWRCGGVLIYGCSESALQSAALERLTRGAVSHIASLGDPAPHIAFPLEGASMSRQLAGVGFAGTHGRVLSTFVLRAGSSEARVAVTANERPVLVSLEGPSIDVFLYAGPVADLAQPVDRRYSLADDYDILLPILIFLRGFFGESCWHPLQSAARLTIDDPLLQRTYGFLDIVALHESMQRADYGATIGFIPWNHWRTSRRATARLAASGHEVSLCIHGCDHVNKEFASSDKDLLGRRARLAVRRMEALSRRTGASVDRVMVFPQGLFSRAAPAALRVSGYLAAVNSSCIPIDADSTLTIRDLLRPAVSRYGAFPVFGRRDLGPLVDFAVDLFLGKPALLVVHHDDLRCGYGRLEHLVTELRRAEPELTWPPLSPLLSASGLQRRLASGQSEVEFFTATFHMGVDRRRAARVGLRRYEPAPSDVARVLVDRVDTPYAFDGDYLTLELDLDPAEPHTVEVVNSLEPAVIPGGFGLMHNLSVAARRALSEFRDNVLARHEGAASVARTVARAMRLTGDS